MAESHVRESERGFWTVTLAVIDHSVLPQPFCQDEVTNRPLEVANHDQNSINTLLR